METELRYESKTNKMNTNRITGAHAVMRSLVEEGVEFMFGYPGGAIMPVYDAMLDYHDDIKHILARHEQGAIHAAQGYYRSSGKVAVAIATSGPGATNLVTGIADAQIDSTAVVCITGQVADHLLGTDAFQETDIIGIAAPVTKWSYQVTKAEEIPWAIAKAMYIAKSGRPGPVVIDIAKNAQFEEFDFEYKKCHGLRTYLPVPQLDDSAVKEAAELLNGAKKPFVIAGQGVLISQAQKELLALAEKADIPVANTLLGLSGFPGDHNLFTGMVGMHGNYGPNIKTNECDVLLAVGMRFDDRVTGDLARYATQAKVIHIEIDAAEIDKNVTADVALHADAKEALKAILPLVGEKKNPDWVQEFKDADEKEYEKVIHNELFPPGEGMKMGEVLKMVEKKTDGKAVIVSDVGQNQMMAARYYRYRGNHSHISSGGLGTMGFALPAAFGAQVGQPNKTVIAVAGDGGIQMTIQELGTVFQSGLPLKILILNNEFLGMVRQWQELFFDKRYASTEMVSPNFQKIAEGYSIEAARCDSRDDLESAVEKMLNHDGSYLLEVMVEKEGNVFPMVATGASVSEIRLE